MDQYIDFLSSPLGSLKIEANDTHLLSIKFMESKEENVNPNDITNETKHQLNRYFNNELKIFTIPVKPEGTIFRMKVWEILTGISFGEVRSYKEVALELGSLLSIRAVGTANGANPIPIIIPCHRVIGSDKKLVGYSGELWRKKWLLEHENAGFSGTLFDSVQYHQNISSIKNQ